MSALSIRYEPYFMNMVFAGESLQRIVSEAATILSMPVRFSPENRIEYAICSPDYPREDIGYVARLLAQENRDFNTFLSVTQQEEAMKPFLCPNVDGRIDRIFCNVMIGSRYFGNLSIPGGETDLTQVDLDFVALVARTIALSCSVTGLWGYDITKSSLLQRVLNGTIRSRTEMMEHFGNWSDYEGKTWRLICADIPKKKEPAVIQNALQMLFGQNSAVIYGDRLLMIIEGDGAPTARQRENLAQMAQMYGCTIVVSLPFHDFLQSREQMLCLTEHPAIRQHTIGCFYYEDHIEYVLFHSTRLQKEYALELFCGALQAIQRHDQQHETRYFETLAAYLDNALNVQKTASALYTHKNTILYRISRLQELFNLDLHDSQTVFRLSLGMSALRYWGG